MGHYVITGVLIHSSLVSSDPKISVTLAVLLRFFSFFTLKKKILCHHAGGYQFLLTFIYRLLTQKQARDYCSVKLGSIKLHIHLAIVSYPQHLVPLEVYISAFSPSGALLLITGRIEDQLTPTLLKMDLKLS